MVGYGGCAAPHLPIAVPLGHLRASFSNNVINQRECIVCCFGHALVQRCASALTVAALLCVVGASPLWDYVHKFDPNYSYVLRCDAGHCVLFYTFHKHAMDSTLVCRSAQIAVDGDGTSVCPVTSFRLIISLSTSSCACNRYFDTGIRINNGSNTGWT